MERLLRLDEYNNNKEAKRFVKGLRNPDDPLPVMIAAADDALPMTALNALQNAVVFCKANPDYEPVKGFKMWVLEHWFGISYNAQVHVVVRHKTTNKYRCVTKPAAGDEGQRMVFVPSSRVHKTYSMEFMMEEFYDKGFNLHLGAVQNGSALAANTSAASPLHRRASCAASPEELALYLSVHNSVATKYLQEHFDWASASDIDDIFRVVCSFDTTTQGVAEDNQPAMHMRAIDWNLSITTVAAHRHPEIALTGISSTPAMAGAVQKMQDIARRVLTP